MPDPENRYDDEALMGLLGGKSPSFASGGPASSTMPIGGAPSVLEMTGGANGGFVNPTRETASDTAPMAAAPQSPRGWNNLSLAAPEQRNINRFEGYNDQRALAGTDTDSAKDGLRRWLGGLDFDLKGKSKDQIGEYFRSQMGNAKDYGLDIRDVQGEKILLNTKERGPEWIDAVMRAGGDDPAFGYISDFDTTGQTLPANTGAGGGVNAAALLGAQQQPSAIDRILAEVAALQSGGASPMDAQALMEALQV